MRGIAGKMFRLSYDSFANSKLMQSFANEVYFPFLKKRYYYYSILIKKLNRVTQYHSII